MESISEIVSGGIMGGSSGGGGGEPGADPEAEDLRIEVKGQKTKTGGSMAIFTVVEVVVGFLSIERLGSGNSPLFRDDGQGGENTTARTEEDEIDSGVIEVILFAIPFMLVTNVLVMIAVAKNNVWLLLPWMVLHCVVIAFLALGAAILSAHGRGPLGFIALLAAIFFLFSWKSLRQLFMSMVDLELRERGISDAEEGFGDPNFGLESEVSEVDLRNRHEMIFFGTKDKQVLGSNMMNKISWD